MTDVGPGAEVVRRRRNGSANRGRRLEISSWAGLNVTERGQCERPGAGKDFGARYRDGRGFEGPRKGRKCSRERLWG